MVKTSQDKPQMQTFEFRILCADRRHSCSFVRGLMKDFKVKTASMKGYYDHTGTRNFENPDLALERLEELENAAGGRIRNAVLARIG